MMLKQLLTNKKIVIVSLAVLLALMIVIVILVIPNSKQTGGTDGNSQTEQSKEDAITDKQEDKKDVTGEGEYSGGNLEVLQPDEVTPENSSDASGSWDEEEESNAQSGNTSSSDETTQTDNLDNQTNNDNENEGHKQEDILKDDIEWGNIY